MFQEGHVTILYLNWIYPCNTVSIKARLRYWNHKEVKTHYEDNIYSGLINYYAERLSNIINYPGTSILQTGAFNFGEGLITNQAT